MPGRKKVYEMFGGRCAYCGKPIKFEAFHIDHIVSKIYGGTRSDDNVYPACVDCNIFKSSRTLSEFRERIENVQAENIATRIMSKYYGVEMKPITFYFEELRDGNL